MADIDALLQELDDVPRPCSLHTHSLSNPFNSTSSLSPGKPVITSKSSIGPTNISTVEDLLNDLNFLENTAPKKSVEQPSNSTVNKVIGGFRIQRTSSITSKCSSLYIGGPQYPRGHGSSIGGTTICCDNVRCTKCDFKVIWFPGEWDSSVDYLFFRNCYPTQEKLKPQIIPKKDYNAYCCQCSWHSLSSSRRIDFSSDLRWLCGGHF